MRTVLRGTGQLLITAGLVLLLFCFYELRVTNLVTARAQERLGEELRQLWGAEREQPSASNGSTPTVGQVVPDSPVSRRAAPQLGTGMAILYVPSFGRDWQPHVVVEGVSVADLKRGPGHMPDTALPGEVGNVVLSGHRTTYGAPFADSDLLRPGDVVVLETRTGWFAYTVRGSEVVTPTAVEVTFAVPGDRSATPTERLLTMTTCNPKYSARQRLVVRAGLSASAPHDAGPPAVLAREGG